MKWSDFKFPPINLWSYPKMNVNKREIMPDGMLSIHDAVFTDSLRRAGVSEETIKWRLLEDISTRGDVIEMYDREAIK